MLASPDIIRDDFDRIASCSRAQPDRIEPATERLLGAVPFGPSRVLEIGCGTGVLSRKLAAGGARVTAIDLSPRMIDVARAGTGDSLEIDYRVSDFMSSEPRGFDVAISSATLHHLPLAEALARMADVLVPGGMVLVADLFAARGLLELPYNGLSWLLRQLERRGAPPADLAAAWAAHGDHDDLLALREIRSVAAKVLPGSTIRRHLGWRYTLVWRKRG